MKTGLTALATFLLVLILSGCAAPLMVQNLQPEKNAQEHHFSQKNYTVGESYAANIGQPLVRVVEYHYSSFPVSKEQAVYMNGIGQESHRTVYSVEFKDGFRLKIPSGTGSDGGSLGVEGSKKTVSYSTYTYPSRENHAIVGTVPWGGEGASENYFVLYLDRPQTSVFGMARPLEPKNQWPALLVNTKTFEIEQRAIFRNGRISKLESPLILEGLNGGKLPYGIGDKIGKSATLLLDKGPYANYELIYNGRDSHSFFITYREYGFEKGALNSMQMSAFVPTIYQNLVFRIDDKIIRYKDMVIEVDRVSNERIVYRVTHDAVDLRSSIGSGK